jgi:hypothetical protein
MRSFAFAVGRLGTIFGAAVALLSSSCVSSDVSSDAKIAGEVAEALPVGTPAPTMVTRAIWFPKATGFSSLEASPFRPLTGVLALAGDKLWFMIWDDSLHAFDMQQTIAVLPARQVSVVHSATAAMLVIESNNMSFDAFELMSGGQFGSDSTTTDGLYAKLKNLRNMNPQTDP